MTNTNSGNAGPKRTFFQRLRLRLFALLFGLVLVEGILQLLTLVLPVARETLVPDAIPSTISHPELGKMPNPRFSGHDDWGFRNEDVPESAAVVVLGDSQTYGTGVLPSSAWPAVLGGHVEGTVYSIAYGGWGQIKQRALLSKALSLKPKVLVVALYLGNDFFDCYRRVYLTDAYVSLRSEDSGVRKNLEEAEARAPLYRTVAVIAEREGRSKGLRGTLKNWSKHVRLLGLAYKVFAAVSGRKNVELTGEVSDAAWKKLRRDAAKSELAWAFTSGRLRTVFTPGRRNMALDPEDPRVVEGCRLALSTIEHMQSEAAKVGTEMVVVLIPTKESSFYDLVDSSGGDVPDLYRALVRNEANFRVRCKSFLEVRKIRAVDMRPVFAAALGAGSFPYPANDDGHPTPHGHGLIADTVRATLNVIGVAR